MRPSKTRAGVTKDAADKFSTIATKIKGRANPEDVAHFVNQLVFCFFADSVKLLPDGLFKKLLKRAAENRERTQKYLNQLFSAMEKGGEFDLNDIAWFNGGLFDGREALPLDDADVGLLIAAGSLDWSQIDPTIFGTLFERFLDPDKRAQIGAHYTDSEKISKIIEPVIMRPLRQEWTAVKAEIVGLLNGTIKPPMRKKPRRAMKADEAAEEARSRFLERLREITILDPACGSGNFLYLALQGVKDIENIANLECEMLGLKSRLPVIGPEIVHGIEINPLAAELARTTIWIGDIQWRLRNGIYAKPKPILRKLDAIECRDAIISSQAGKTIEAIWPSAEFIVGNPPFLGGKLMRGALGDEYVQTMRRPFQGRLSEFADLVCYWFEKANRQLDSGASARVGLVATNSIRGGANRKVLDDIAEKGRFIEAWSDEPWVVDGAAVRVSLVCFGKKSEHDVIRLNGVAVDRIHPDLTAGISNLTSARRLTENTEICFEGGQKYGDFDVSQATAQGWLQAPLNPNGRPNSDVLRPYLNANDLVRRNTSRWIIDFGDDFTENEAALYEGPFQHIEEHVKPARLDMPRKTHRVYWWRHGWVRKGLEVRRKLLKRMIVTPVVSKHRVFSWVSSIVFASNLLDVIARDDDTTFGILHSRFHEMWALRLGTSLEDRPRYTPTTTFETFPFPDRLSPNIPAQEYASDPHAIAIATAAKRLDELRNAWLNPLDLVQVIPEVVPGYPDRIVAKNAAAEAELKKRTLTNLYNQRPQWLRNAHHDLDKAVADAYGWPVEIPEEDALALLLSLNRDRSCEATLDLGDGDEQPSPSIIPR